MTRFSWNSEVVCTELEDGAVLLNMDSRLYYSINRTGLELFRLLSAGADEESLVRQLRGRFDVGEASAAAAVSRFLEQLAAEGLVITGGGGSESAPLQAEADAGERKPFVEPELIKHEEPLHDVSTSPFDPQLPLAE